MTNPIQVRLTPDAIQTRTWQHALPSLDQVVCGVRERYEALGITWIDPVGSNHDKLEHLWSALDNIQGIVLDERGNEVTLDKPDWNLPASILTIVNRISHSSFTWVKVLDLGEREVEIPGSFPSGWVHSTYALPSQYGGFPIFGYRTNQGVLFDDIIGFVKHEPDYDILLPYVNCSGGIKLVDCNTGSGTISSGSFTVDDTVGIWLLTGRNLISGGDVVSQSDSSLESISSDNEIDQLPTFTSSSVTDHSTSFSYGPLTSSHDSVQLPNDPSYDPLSPDYCTLHSDHPISYELVPQLPNQISTDEEIISPIAPCGPTNYPVFYNSTLVLNGVEIKQDPNTTWDVSKHIKQGINHFSVISPNAGSHGPLWINRSVIAASPSPVIKVGETDGCWVQVDAIEIGPVELNKHHVLVEGLVPLVPDDSCIPPPLLEPVSLRIDRIGIAPLVTRENSEVTVTYCPSTWCNDGVKLTKWKLITPAHELNGSKGGTVVLTTFNKTGSLEDQVRSESCHPYTATTKLCDFGFSHRGFVVVATFPSCSECFDTSETSIPPTTVTSSSQGSSSQPTTSSSSDSSSGSSSVSDSSSESSISTSSDSSSLSTSSLSSSGSSESSVSSGSSSVDSTPSSEESSIVSAVSSSESPVPTVSIPSSSDSSSSSSTSDGTIVSSEVEEFTVGPANLIDPNTAEFPISNNGTGSLTVSNISADVADWDTTPSTPFIIEPSDSTIVMITSTQSLSGAFVLITTSAGEQDLQIP